MSNSNYFDENSLNIGNSTKPSVYFTCGLLALIILLIDFYTPHGVASGVLYVIVVLISLKSPRKHFTIVVASICTVLVGIGYIGSPASEIPMYQVFANRLLAIFVIWVTTVLTLMQRDKTNELYQERLRSLQSAIEAEMWEEKLRLLKTTLRTAQGITDDFFNDPHLSKLEIDRSKTLSPETVKKLDEFIQDTSLQLNKLRNLEEVRTKGMEDDTIAAAHEHPTKDKDKISKMVRLIKI